MREEREILDSVIGYASSEDAVRAVIRTELVPVREYLYTYNFCFIVNDISKFDDDCVFADCFGDRILLFRGDKNYPEMFPGTKAHLMVFRDGVTIVIHAMDGKAFLERFNREKHYENVWIGDTFKKLLDKDNMLPDIDRMEEKQILFADRPSEEECGRLQRVLVGAKDLCGVHAERRASFRDVLSERFCAGYSQ